jgi:alkaline phosphatase D
MYDGYICTPVAIYAGKQNFGGLEINWDADPVAINVDIRDVHGVPVLGTSFTLNELQPGYQRVQPPQHGQVQRHCTLEIELPWHQRYLLAILFFGTLSGNTSLAFSILCKVFHKGLQVFQNKGSSFETIYSISIL